MKFDMHCHTREGSIDARVSIREYLEIIKEKGFGGMLATDHDSYGGYDYWAAHRDEMPEGVIVIRGVEYDTRDSGHFLVIVPDDVNIRLLTYRGMGVEALTRIVHRMGGVLGPAHPFGMRSSSAMFFRKLKKDPWLFREFDFLEGMNTCEKVSANAMARELADRYDLPCVGGSDAHKAIYAGTCFTDFDRDITSAQDMIDAIREGGIAAFGGKEREFLRSHNKRNWFATTWGFRAFNFGVGALYTPVRRHELNQLMREEKGPLDRKSVV